MRRSRPGADFVGFVFFPPSPRHLGFELARALGARVGRPRPQGCALGRCRRRVPGRQRSRRSSPTCCSCTAARRPSVWRMVRARLRLPVMKALPVAERADLARDRALCQQSPIASHVRCARAARRHPPGRPRPRSSTGGCCRISTFRVPFMLSGGLDAGNVAEALRITRAGGVDVSSGVERAPGEKDADKIQRLHPRRARGGVAEATLRCTHEHAAAQFVPHRPRRARAFRHLRRPFRRRDADAADSRAREGLCARPRPIRHSKSEMDGYLTHYVGRPSPLISPSG